MNLRNSPFIRVVSVSHFVLLITFVCCHFLRLCPIMSLSVSGVVFLIHEQVDRGTFGSAGFES